MDKTTGLEISDPVLLIIRPKSEILQVKRKLFGITRKMAQNGPFRAFDSKVVQCTIDAPKGRQIEDYTKNNFSCTKILKIYANNFGY